MYGIFSRSTIGATARPDELKPEPITPRNLSSSATLFMWLTACDGFEPSSKSWTRTRRPLIPPRALISLTAASTPWRLSTPTNESGPVSGEISANQTSAGAAPPPLAPARTRATAMSAPTPNRRPLMFSSPSVCDLRTRLWIAAGRFAQAILRCPALHRDLAAVEVPADEDRPLDGAREDNGGLAWVVAPPGSLTGVPDRVVDLDGTPVELELGIAGVRARDGGVEHAAGVALQVAGLRRARHRSQKQVAVAEERLDWADARGAVLAERAEQRDAGFVESLAPEPRDLRCRGLELGPAHLSSSSSSFSFVRSKTRFALPSSCRGSPPGSATTACTRSRSRSSRTSSSLRCTSSRCAIRSSDASSACTSSCGSASRRSTTIAYWPATPGCSRSAASIALGKTLTPRITSMSSTRPEKRAIRGCVRPQGQSPGRSCVTSPVR